MNAEEMLQTLQGVRFLHDIADDYLKPIVPIAEFIEFPAGAVLFREGQSHARFYLILRGSVALEVHVSHREVKRIQTIGEGELLGLSPVLGQAEMTATARVLQPVQAVAIVANQMLALCEQNSRLGFEFMRRTAQALTSRLIGTRLQLLDVYNHELPGIPSGKEV